jgi:hypothetical protein
MLSWTMQPDRHLGTLDRHQQLIELGMTDLHPFLLDVADLGGYLGQTMQRMPREQNAACWVQTTRCAEQ